MSTYYVKRKGYSKVQGPYSLERLSRYVEEQRLLMCDLISKDGDNWKHAGSFTKLFPIMAEASATMTYTLSESEPYLSSSAFETCDASASTLREKSKSEKVEQEIEELVDDWESDSAFVKNFPKQTKLPLIVVSTFFVFGVSFGFGLFLIIQSLMK